MARILFMLVSMSWVYLGMQAEKRAWERKSMGDLCYEGYTWACELHPECTMRSLHCFPKIAEFKVK